MVRLLSVFATWLNQFAMSKTEPRIGNAGGYTQKTVQVYAVKSQVSLVALSLHERRNILISRHRQRTASFLTLFTYLPPSGGTITQWCKAQFTTSGRESIVEP